MSSKIKIEIVAGVEGKSCYINGRRVCGNKPWGGGSVIYKGDAEIGAVMQAIGVHYNNKLPYPWHSVKAGELPQAGKVCMFGYQGKLYKGFMYKDGALHFDDEFSPMLDINELDYWMEMPELPTGLENEEL